MLRAFRLLGMAEALSFLLLLGFAMPLKYVWGMPLAVRIVGAAHGLLFLLYLGAALGAAVTLKWPFSRLFLAGLASLLPFGPFAFDRWVLGESGGGNLFATLKTRGGLMKAATILAVTGIAIAATAAYVRAQSAHTLPASLAAPGAAAPLPRVGPDVFGEGVAADWQGNVYFNEMGSNNRTMQVKAGQDSAKAWRSAKDAPNGIWLDTQNRLIICQAKAIVRVKAGAAFDGKTDTLYKYPNTGSDFNDVTGDSKDNIYFTNFAGRTVFFRDAATGTTREVLLNQPRPNGIEWDEERKIVYVCENEAGKVAAYTVGDDFSLSNRKELGAVAGADGIVLDSAGNVYAVAFGSAVKVFSPAGSPLGEIPIPGNQLTNLAFGGADYRTLYMVTNRGLYKLPMKVKGYKSGNYSVRLARPASGPAALALVPGAAGHFRADGRKADPAAPGVRALSRPVP